MYETMVFWENPPDLPDEPSVGLMRGERPRPLLLGNVT